VKKMGASLVVSEMIASQAMIRDSKRTLKMVEKCPEEHPATVQLAGCEPAIMAEAAKLNEDLGADIIDINMGCPAKKVVNGYAGSALMKDLNLARQIIEATVKAVNLPVTLKMRTGWDETSRNAPELAKIAQDCGIQLLAVHGRTRCQLYNGRSDWSFIKNVKEEQRGTLEGFKRLVGWAKKYEIPLILETPRKKEIKVEGGESKEVLIPCEEEIAIVNQWVDEVEIPERKSKTNKITFKKRSKTIVTKVM